jgi:aldose 1-epimerase
MRMRFARSRHGDCAEMAVAGDPRILELANGELAASFASHAGMVGCSLRHRGQELLGLGGGLDAYLEHGAVFGIPLLYPWANRLGGWSYAVAGRRVELDRGSSLLHGDEHCLPIHGALAATSDWIVAANGPSWLVAGLDYGAHPDLLAVFPFPHRIELAIRLAPDRLTVTTTVTAAGSPVPLSFGFHPYLAPAGTPRERWRVELPARTELLLDDHNLPTGATRDHPAQAFALGAQTFDDLFALPSAPSRFAVSGAGRRLIVEMTSGFPYAQVFAPADQAVICFEPMTAPVNALRTHEGLRMVPPGETARATFAIAIEAS